MATKKPTQGSKQSKPLTLNQRHALKETKSSPETDDYEVVIECNLHDEWQKVGKILPLTSAQAYLFEQQGKLKKVTK
ncbi:hypothetical protein P7F88_25060 [Vibrio hannami]|uniref:hypothetical protein n=1 Tax=Vibrio hannami TaxID=2717094 RepID=UPI002410A3E1|nr:hypothetical protein [Vibrio hannami]MDG3089134.1 hypothetical protein [Vibrio hannami]